MPEQEIKGEGGGGGRNEQKLGKEKAMINFFWGGGDWMSSKDKINTTVIGILESTINGLQVELMAEGIAFRKRPP